MDAKEHRMLIVDDDEPTRLTLREAAATMGLPAEAAASGEEALALLGAQRFWLLLLDLRLPGLDGMAVLRYVRDHHPDVRVVVLTGHGTAADAVEAVSLGVADFLPKPLTFAELRTRILQLLQREALHAEDRGYAALIERGRAQINRRQFDAAAAYVREALARDDAQPEAHTLLGILHELRGDRAAARACYEQALAWDFSYAPARRHLRRATDPAPPDAAPPA